jgi:hypothetical protein
MVMKTISFSKRVITGIIDYRKLFFLALYALYYSGRDSGNAVSELQGAKYMWLRATQSGVTSQLASS